MTSNFTEKIKESGISVIPVMVIVLLLNYTIAPMGAGQVPQFLVGGVLLILGLGIFLVGADIGMVPFGQRVGAALTYKKSLALILGAAFAIGFAITIAEPDVQVLATQVNDVAPSINKQMLLVMIAVGVGIFLVIAMLRVIFKLSLRLLLFIFYGLVFLLCSFVEPAFVSVAFDSGGATTGPVTVPFIMALGIGVAATGKKKEGDDSSFGMVGLASIGPIMAVAFMGFFSSVSMTGGGGEAKLLEQKTLVQHFLHFLPHVSKEILFALLPVVALFVFFQVTLLHLPSKQVKRILLGFIYTFIGLVLFMVGVNGGFSPAGKALGLALGAMGGGGWLLVPIGLLLGAVVVCAEPAVWVLNEQVETLSGGYIKRSIMLTALCISVAFAVAIGMVRVVTSLSIWWVLVPGYACALLMTRFCPPLFTAIAFDSGGVASGPMATTFILSLTLGASAAIPGGNPATDAFGMVAMIAMAPLITIQLLGLIFKQKEKQQKQMEAAR
ncbi:DUF1538 domain-containing protein [Desulfococcaceae bacterium OttesenSCG-928-F15]|nr:DUF1538 domain-containing protein [Desulfococcaceae bacterium OttesenSCG-928-F15]